ncbi:MAG TPA: ABC transporter substrate-binding protein [Usitatibacter sp.]|nr:ABC transporter substrate-binding protein [Usitatibacter sp.]
MTLRRGAASAALFLLLLALGADGKTLRYASQDDPQTLDPHSANLLTSSRVTMQVFEPLVWRDREWKTIPWLATSWRQATPTLWRFKLRDGVKFHDGTPFTADDVVFSVERALHPLSQMRTAIQGVESARRIDDRTVELVLTEPNPALLQHLTNFRIMSRAWAVKNRAEKPQDYKNKEDSVTARSANGTGPFIVREWSPDVRVRLEQNREWWGHKAGLFESNVTEVHMLPVKSAATRLAALLSGEVDLVIDPPTQDVERLKSNPQLKVTEGAEMRVQYLAFDLQRDELLYGSVKGKNPFKDLRVRQAVAHAIDAEAIRQKVMRGLSRPHGAIITSLVAGYHADGDKRLPYDRERAKKLLAEAGYPAGFDVTLDCGNNQPAMDICQAVAAMLTQVGIRTRPNIVVQSSFFPKIEKHDTSLYLLSWGGGVTSDALYSLNALLHSVGKKGEGDFNLGRWSNTEMDGLIAQIKGEQDMEKRNEAIRKALVLAARELPVVTIHQPLIPWAMRRNVTAWMSPVNTVYFRQVRIE